MNIPEGLKYTREHEWVKLEGDVAIVGITEYAQGELGDIVFVELPPVGKAVKQMESFGTIEAVKAVSEMFSPLSVDSFGKMMQIQKITKRGIENLRDDVEMMASAEGLDAHKNSIAIRFND